MLITEPDITTILVNGELRNISFDETKDIEKFQPSKNVICVSCNYGKHIYCGQITEAQFDRYETSSGDMIDMLIFTYAPSDVPMVQKQLDGAYRIVLYANENDDPALGLPILEQAVVRLAGMDKNVMKFKVGVSNDSGRIYPIWIYLQQRGEAEYTVSQKYTHICFTKNTLQTRNFNSQISHLVKIGSSAHKIKVFRNGSLQIPGIKKTDLSDARRPIEVLLRYLSHTLQSDVELVGIRAMNTNYKMMLCDPTNLLNVSVINEFIKTHQDTLMQDGQPICILNPRCDAEESTKIQFQARLSNIDKLITIKLFYSGRINFDSCNHPEACEQLRVWLNDFLEANREQFILNSIEGALPEYEYQFDYDSYAIPD